MLTQNSMSSYGIPPGRDIPSMHTHDLFGARPRQNTLNRNIWQHDYVQEQIKNQPTYQERQENLNKQLRNPLFTDFHYQKVDLNKPTQKYEPPEIFRGDQFASKLAAIDSPKPAQQHNDSLQNFMLRQSALSGNVREQKDYRIQNSVRNYEQEYGQNKSELVMHIDPGKTMQRSQPFSNFQSQQVDESKSILRGDMSMYSLRNQSPQNNSGNNFNYGAQSPGTSKNAQNYNSSNFKGSGYSNQSTERIPNRQAQQNNVGQQSNQGQLNQQQEKYQQYLQNQSQQQQSNNNPQPYSPQQQVKQIIQNNRQQVNNQHPQQQDQQQQYSQKRVPSQRENHNRQETQPQNENLSQSMVEPPSRRQNSHGNQNIFMQNGSLSVSQMGKKTYKPYNVITHKRHQKYEPKYELSNNHWDCYDKPKWEDFPSKKNAPVNIFQEKNKNNIVTADYSTTNYDYGVQKKKYNV